MHTHRRNSKLLRCLSASFLCCAWCLVEAQQDNEASLSEETKGLALEEVIVTARKRDESLQDVPISITTVSGDRLQEQAIHQMETFATSVPNFHYSLQPSSNDSVFIRGIGSGVNFGFETAVGMVVDGFFYGKTKFGRAAFLDLERVEVLKGPQGAILGKNNSAGAIVLTTAKPTDEFESEVRLTGFFEGDEGYSAEGFVSGPLTESLKGRVAFLHDNYDGFIENLNSGEMEQDRDDWTGRATLEWTPREELSLTASYQHVDFTRTGHGRELFFCGPGKSAELTSPGLPADDCEANFRKSTNVVINGERSPDRFEQELDMAHLTIEWDVMGHVVTSLTGYMQYDTLDRFDSDNTPTNSQYIEIPDEYDQVLQELRINSSADRYSYTAGLFFLSTEQDATFNFILPPADLALVLRSQQESETLAGFGDFTFRLTDEFDVTFGARYTHEEKDLEQVHFFGIPFTSTEIAQVYQISPTRSENNFSPNVDLQWKPNDDMMFYGSVRKGFRGGGFDRFLFASDQASAEASVEFDDENVIAYELGGKVELFENSMRLNAALFRSEYDDLQVSSFITATQFQVFNAASATTQGIEVELDWAPADRFLTSASFAYLDAEYDEFPNAACYIGQTEGCTPLGQDLSGKELAFAPEFEASIDATYTWSLGEGLRLTVFGQLNHTSSFYLGGDLHPAKKQESYQLLNGRVALSSSNDTWEVAIIGRNLTDETVFTAANNSSPDGIDAFLLAPRSLGVQGTYRF